MTTTYPTEDDLTIRALALGTAGHVMAAILEPNTATAFAETQTVRLSKRLETYLREGT